MNFFDLDFAVKRAQADSSKLYKYKDSITVVLLVLIFIGTDLAEFLPEEVKPVFVSLAGVAAFIVTRFLPGAITDSMAERIGKHLPVRPETADNSEASGQVVDRNQGLLPVIESVSDYVGAHRADGKAPNYRDYLKKLGF